MAGRGPAPDPDRLRKGAPARGDWEPSPDGGWQHELPEPPPGISATAAQVWRGWFTAWWAGHWTPDDVPNLRFVLRLWDRVYRGDVKRAGELRQWMDSFGLTPKGQMDRRWRRPDPPRPKSQWERLRDEADRSRFKELPGGSASDRYRRTQDERDIKDRLKRIEAQADRGSRSRFETIIGEHEAEDAS